MTRPRERPTHATGASASTVRGGAAPSRGADPRQSRALTKPPSARHEAPKPPSHCGGPRVSDYQANTHPTFARTCEKPWRLEAGQSCHSRGGPGSSRRARPRGAARSGVGPGRAVCPGSAPAPSRTRRGRHARPRARSPHAHNGLRPVHPRTTRAPPARLAPTSGRAQRPRRRARRPGREAQNPSARRRGGSREM